MVRHIGWSTSADRDDLFPESWREGQQQRLDAMWDLSNPLPVPRFQPRCPVCACFPLMIKDWKFHTRVRTGSASPWRCDVRMKCPGCSYVAAFGIAVPEQYYQATSAIHTPRLGRYVSWREGRRLLTEAGYLDA